MDIVCVHTFSFYFLTLDNYLIKKKVSHTPCKSAALRLGELRGTVSLTHTRTHTHRRFAVQFKWRSKTVYLITIHQTDICLLQEWTMWHKWVWSLSLKKQAERGKRDLLLLSIWSIQTLLEPQKDKRFAEKCTIHNLYSNYRQSTIGAD